MTTITDGTTTLHPTLWMNYRSTRESNTQVHTLQSGKNALTLRPAGSRRVTVALLFEDENESKRCEDMHARPGIITITEDGRDTASMQYAVIGSIERALDPETASVWFVTVEVLEVTA
ncbi:hypothetical protein FB468_0576 [Leucobacter komagatae]|uniref:Uncharacterized protein n=1 Tax=Leucobacter komagatae TaxID=55969 RepID=A0A542Y3C3_9MICO|nr:hypothetical protein [Leucobacter komagatae]TQL42574.1 hypothetical protein FB468_0576 [Leucobacter komagatae]